MVCIPERPGIMNNRKELEMTIATRHHFTALVAALFCAFATVGTSIAPAIAPAASLVA